MVENEKLLCNLLIAWINKIDLYIQIGKISFKDPDPKTGLA